MYNPPSFKVLLSFSLAFSLASCERPLDFIYYPQGSNKYHRVYFIDNFRHNAQTEAAIDSFVCRELDTIEVPKDKLFEISIYKTSKKTNLEYLKENPGYFTGDFIIGDGGSYAEDFVWLYLWLSASQGKKFLFANKNIKNLYTTQLDCKSQ